MKKRYSPDTDFSSLVKKINTKKKIPTTLLHSPAINKSFILSIAGSIVGRARHPTSIITQAIPQRRPLWNTPRVARSHHRFLSNIEIRAQSLTRSRTVCSQRFAGLSQCRVIIEASLACHGRRRCCHTRAHCRKHTLIRAQRSTVSSRH